MILHLLLCSLFYLFLLLAKRLCTKFLQKLVYIWPIESVLLLGPISMTYIDLEKKVSCYHDHVEIKQSSSARECIVGLALFSQLHLFQAIIGYRSCFSTTAVEMLLLLCALCKPSFKVWFKHKSIVINEELGSCSSNFQVLALPSKDGTNH